MRPSPGHGEVSGDNQRTRQDAVLGRVSTWATVSPQKGPHVGSATGVGRLIMPSTFPTDPGLAGEAPYDFYKQKGFDSKHSFK